MNVNENFYWNNIWFLCVCLWKVIVLFGKCFFLGLGIVFIKSEYTIDFVNYVEGYVVVFRIFYWIYNYKNKILLNCYVKFFEKYFN